MSRDRRQDDARTIAMYVAPVPNALLVSVPDASLMFTHASDDPVGLDAIVRTAAANLRGVAEEQLRIETHHPADVLTSDVLAGVIGDVTRIGAEDDIYSSEQALAAVHAHDHPAPRDTPDREAPGSAPGSPASPTTPGGDPAGARRDRRRRAGPMSPLKRAPVSAHRDPDVTHMVIKINSNGQAHGSVRDSSEVSVDGPVTEILGKLVSAVAASVGKPVGGFRWVLTTITSDGERILSPPFLGDEDDYAFDDWADPRTYDLWFARHLYEHRLLASGEELVVDAFAVRIFDHQLLAVPGTDIISVAPLDDDDALEALGARVSAQWGMAGGSVRVRVFTACQVLSRWTLEAILKSDFPGMHAYLIGREDISVGRALDLMSAMLHQNPVRRPSTKLSVWSKSSPAPEGEPDGR